jgi:polysaccharide pyruvyl transferase WcaK-like protein
MTAEKERPVCRIALLTPYHGNNLGDASIQDALITNVNFRVPQAKFYGISLNSDNFVDQHGAGAFPLAARHVRWYGMTYGRYAKQSNEGESQGSHAGKVPVWRSLAKRTLRNVPVLSQCLKLLAIIPQEIGHFVAAYRFLRRQNLLIVSGGGQLNEQYGGAWAQPFALFKWAVVARVARVPYVIASVGLGRIESTASKVFIRGALRMASYRSYRDKNTGRFAAGLLKLATADPIVPDLAFSLPSSQLPRPEGIRALAQSRTVVGISPIAFAKPGAWPSEDDALHQRYVRQMAEVVSEFLKRGYFLVIVCSSLGDDESVIPEIVERLDDEARRRLGEQAHIPTIATWRNFVATLRDVDILIASRLHSVILAFVSEVPTIAVSFDPKVDWVMEDVGQTDYLLSIADFTSANVIEAFDRLEPRRKIVAQEIAAYRRSTLPVAARQYDILAALAAGDRGHE